MSRLEIGDPVPVLTGKTLSGKEISLKGYEGKALILAFYRYAGCQFCNLRIHDFIKKYNQEYAPRGIETIAVFQSPIKKMEKYTTDHEAPFEFVSDPKCRWYRAFGVEKSWTGFAMSGKNVKGLYRSIAKGYGRIDPDGAINRLPAEFLIGKDGYIEDAYYGSDISDHIPFSRISKWIQTAE